MYLSITISSHDFIVVPWTIVNQEDEHLTFIELYMNIKGGVFATIPSSDDNSSLESVYVGTSKESFSIVEMTHNVNGVCRIFGSFVKFIVSAAVEECLQQTKRFCQRTEDDEFGRAPLVVHGLPHMISNERTRKDTLFNEILKFLSEKKVGWIEPDVYGKPFVVELRNVLWYIDGHHQVFASRSCPIPAIFSRFVGYNKPELSKHRKRSISNMSKDTLNEYVIALQEFITSSWMQQQEWLFIKEGLLKLIESMSAYISYLSIKNKAMKEHHLSPEPPTSFSDSSTLRFIKKSLKVSPLLSDLDKAILSVPFYFKVSVREYSPLDKRRRYLFLRELEQGLSVPIFLFTYTHHSNVGNYNFIWKINTDIEEVKTSTKNIRLIEEIKKEIPVYHTRAMRKEFFNLYGRLSPESKPYILRSIYRTLTNDCSASRTLSEKEIDARVEEALLTEDPDIIVDLRVLNSTGSDNFTIFWSKCNEFLTTCTSVHERRHGTITFLAKAISIRDLIQQVAQMCPEGTPVPSESWVRFNFSPKNPRTYVAKQYRSRIQAKHMVQKRQFRNSHPDSHYCAALFRYIREYAVLLRDVAIFTCIDDKHRVRVGEPNFPVAAVERGREVIVSLHDTFAVGDHDFTKFSLIPSVSLIVNIPTDIDGSWYSGDVYVGMKDAVFEPSSPIRHARELYGCLLPRMIGRSALFLYSDGGPDHNLSHISVQLSLIALFLNLDLDLLVAGQTAPSHSWANPVERIMSIINLGFQCVGVMRKKLSDDVEKVFSTCGNLKELRSGCIEHKAAVKETLQPAKELLHSVLQRLELKDKKFQVFESATLEEVNDFWEILLTVDAKLTQGDTSKDSLRKLSDINQFITHCCTFTKYSFTIKKCGESTCSMCKPIRMSSHTFSRLYPLPNPVIGEDGHYEQFLSVFGKDTLDSVPPSVSTKKKQSLGFNVTQQHAKYTGTVIQCEICNMWRLIFSKRKLSVQGRADLLRLLGDISYSCGAFFNEIELPDSLTSICVKHHTCHDPIEKLYYSSGYEPICIHCGCLTPDDNEAYYPQCSGCQSKQGIKKTKKRIKNQIS